MTGEWRYSINYGPEGEANYAMVYDGAGMLVGNLKTFHAAAVVNAMNSASALEALRADKERLERGLKAALKAKAEAVSEMTMSDDANHSLRSDLKAAEASLAGRDAEIAKAVAEERERVVARIQALRPNYQSNTATDAGRRQMLDYFEEFITAALSQEPRS